MSVEIEKTDFFQKNAIFIIKRTTNMLFDNGENTYYPQTEEWRTIPNNERYIISTFGDVIDLTPQAHLKLDEEPQPRKIKEKNETVRIVRNGKPCLITVKKLMQMTFPEYYTTPKEKIEELKEKSLKQETIKIPIKLFNQMLFPNTLQILYARSQSCKKPFKVKPTPDGQLLLYKRYNYFGIGTKNLIHMSPIYYAIPENSTPFAEPRITYRKKV